MAYSFDGSADHLALGDLAAYKVLGDLTWAAWVQVNTGFSTGRVIVSIEGGSGEGETENSTLFISIQGGAGAIDLRYIHEFSDGQNEANDFNTNLVEDTWAYVAFVRDVSANTVDCYLGGLGTVPSALTTFTYTNDPTNTSSNLTYTLGSRTGGGARAVCTLAEVAFDDTVWALGDIISHWSMGLRGVAQKSLISAVPLWGGYDTTDISGNTRNGTVTGSLTVADHPPVGRFAQDFPAIFAAVGAGPGNAEERRAASGIWLPLIPGVTPNVSKDAEWRQQSGWSYSGIAADTPAVGGRIMGSLVGPSGLIGHGGGLIG